jgi:hypothetical protein
VNSDALLAAWRRVGYRRRLAFNHTARYPSRRPPPGCFASLHSRPHPPRLPSPPLDLTCLRPLTPGAASGHCRELQPPPQQQRQAFATACPGDGVDSVVEFRYVYDDASWSRARARAKQRQQHRPELIRAEKHLRKLQLQGQQAGSVGSEVPEADDAGGAGIGSGGDWASRMVQQAAAAAAAAAAAQGSRQQQQQQPGGRSVPAERRRGSEAGEGGAATERCFVEEVRVAAGGRFGCPLCSVTCADFQVSSGHRLLQLGRRGQSQWLGRWLELLRGTGRDGDGLPPTWSYRSLRLQP